MKNWVAAKIHGIVVTDRHFNYHGSVTIAERLLEAAGIEPYEQVHVVNLESGARWVTYALPGPESVFETNGGGAHLAKPGDRCVVMTYAMTERFEGARVLMMRLEGEALLPNVDFDLLRYP
ncbi:MAG TPA: aspartate 1-decarboxylase [Chloroflexota bacterium]|jgi:aspartate 1-decarboxylase